MKIITKPVVHSWDIEEEFGIRVFDCEFTQMAENDTYVSLCLNNDRIIDLWEDIKYYSEKGDGEAPFVLRLKNELELINKFRDMGYNDEILVFVSW